MADDGQNAKGPLASLTSATKFTAVAAGVCYGLGFLIVNRWLTIYGIAEPSLLESRYFVAGMLYVALSIPAAVVAVTAATVLGANPKKVRPKDWIGFTIATFCVGWLVAAIFYTLLSFLASVLSVKNIWPWVTTNVAALTLIILAAPGTSCFGNIFCGLSWAPCF